MPVEVTFSPEDSLVVIRYSGTITANDLQVATEQADKHLKSSDCSRVLVDVRGTESDISSVKIYDMPKLYDSLGVPRDVLIAMVGPKTTSGYDDFLFYKTVCKNRGFSVEVFDDMESAKAWLTGQEDRQ